jgi:hypothetical protein
VFASTTIIATAAGILTTFSNVPQVLKCWRTGNTKDLSTKMLLALSAEHPVGYTRRLGGKQLRLLSIGLFPLRRPRPQPSSQEACAAGPWDQIDVGDEARTTPPALEHDFAAVEGLELRAMTDAHDRGRIELGS